MPDRLLCRPIREGDLHVVDRLSTDPEVLGSYAWTGWSKVMKWRTQWAESRCLTDDGGMLAVAPDDTAVGFVTWRKVSYNAVSHSWNIGLCMLPEERRKGTAAKAARWLVGYLFAHTLANRIEAHADMDNVIVCRSMENMGFTSEGVVRGAAFRNGQWRDLMLYSLLRTDPQPPAATEQQ